MVIMSWHFLGKNIMRKFFLSIPHSGHKIPEEVADKINPKANLKEIAEPYLWQIFNWRVSRLISPIHQCFPNLNRALNNINPKTGIQYSKKLEVVPKEDFSGVSIYKEEITNIENKLISKYYLPYYKELIKLAKSGKYEFFIDVHSMNSVKSSHDNLDIFRPDICLGNLGSLTLNDGKVTPSFPKSKLVKLREYLIYRGYTCEINYPFSGGNIIFEMKKFLPCFQLEIKKSVFMENDESGLLSEKADKLSKDLYKGIKLMLK